MTLKKGDVIRYLERNIDNIRIDTSMPQGEFNKLQELLGDNPQNHFIGFAYSGPWGFFLPQTIEGWEALHTLYPQAFEKEES